MKLNELFTNDDGRLSTTNTIQMISALTLCAGFIVSIVLEKSVTAELGFTIAAMATATATSKGFIARKEKKDE